MGVGLQTPSSCLQNYSSFIISPPTNSLFSSHRTVSNRIVSAKLVLNNESKPYSIQRRIGNLSLSRLNRRLVVVHASKKEDDLILRKPKYINLVLDEPFRGKSGSVTFSGISHEYLEESKLVSAPFDEDSGSFLWVLAPIALIASLVLPQFVNFYINKSFEFKPMLSELVSSFTSDIIFYIGLSTFLKITDHIQKPYLQFSPKRWGLITGLRGYLTSAYFTTGLKITVPLFALWSTWPLLGPPALISVLPFLSSFAVQLLFENRLEERNSSSWPLVPLIFEVYRLYQSSKAVIFMQRLMMPMKGAALTNKVMATSGALIAMVLAFQVVGFTCLWSLLTFLMRLFPSRPVAENY